MGMERVIVAGISGSGKTTMATALAARLGLPRTELDGLYHGPQWVKRPEFEDDVATFSAEPRWVCEEQYYSTLGGLLWTRADTLVWLDLPRRTVMWRVVRRSVLRVVTRRELWNGNRETLREFLFDPEHPMRWAWTRHSVRRAAIGERLAAHPHLAAIRLRSAREVRHWLRGVQGVL
ncbi:MULTISPECIES: adenylate kinase [unclassified Streptomyces]|uniref:adenylate kinase n=1 Tax=unclassified Streptomyces TaxID=2593676 RepID=UPI0029B2A03F|nr:adenylate kinase [Streptomyces sp. DK15]MDX2394903.1 adenylate kinase [Streptomyces sp. DK15]